MLRFAYWLLFVLLLLCRLPPSHAASSSSSGPHIAEVNILLPPKMTYPVEYRLRGSDGCFTWSWDHHDILSVLPEYNMSSSCSTSAQLKSIAPYSGRKETAVYATDVHTGMVIRCKVYIDNFSRIQIFHNSIKLDLEGLATLRVRAFDDEDNEFSSLVGLRFMWQLKPETDGLRHHLVHVPLEDSPLSDCGGLCNDLNVRSRLEGSGEFSDLFVVKGTEIGQESVSVHLLETFHGHMTDSITLTVAEAMSLDPPSPVVTLIGAVVHFTLKVIRGNIPQVVNLPSPHHQWSVLNSSVAQVDATMGIAHALNLGATTISVEDTRVAGHLQMASLRVALPDSLSLYLLPLSIIGERFEGVTSIPPVVRWYIISGRQYLVHMKVFTEGPWPQEIHITESDDLKLHEDLSEHWNTYPVPLDSFAINNGWRNSRILKATSRGVGKLSATLTYTRGHDEAKEVLKVAQEVMVCDQVKFSSDGISSSQNILLPWAPGVYQEVELEVIGGCGSSFSDYKWFSSDMATVSVSASGVFQAKKPGKATIKVVSNYDSFNYDEIVIEVSVPSSLTMLPNLPVEAVVHSHIPAAVTMQALNGAYFHKCDAFDSFIRWEVGGDSFRIVNATTKSLVLEEQELYNGSLIGPPCSWTLLHATSPGRTSLHATVKKEYHDFLHSTSGSIGLKSSSDIAAYLPLIVGQAVDGNQFGGYWFDLFQAENDEQLETLDSLYLAPSTHMDVMLIGGPKPWDQEVEYIETVEILNEDDSHIKDAVTVHQISAGYGSRYRVSCLNLGTFTLIFRRGNLVGKNHYRPAVAESEMLMRCIYPSSIVLIADEEVNALAVIKSEIQARHSSGHVRSLPVTVANGRSIRVSAVGVSDSGEAFGNSSSLQVKWELINCDGLAVWDDAYSTTLAKSSWERQLVLQNSSGQCTVRATVIKLTEQTSHLTDAISLQIVSTLRVTPEFTLIFFSPDAKSNISVFGGSCFLNSIVNDTRIVDIIPPPPDLRCSQLVLTPKRLGTALVTVHDMGLSPPLAASSVVQVADVDWIMITSGDEISIMEGSSQSINLVAGIDDGSQFDPSQYIFMNIHVHIEDDVIELEDSEFLKAPNFVIQARHLGITTLYLSVRQQSGHDIMTQPIKIEVYAAPSLHPDGIFLVPGASYMLTVIGGPTLGTHVEYASMDGDTAVIDKSSGHLSAIAPGNTTIVVRFYKDEDQMICNAFGKVTVGVPSSMMLDVQSKHLAIGREMPIFPSFSEGNLFSFYELCQNYEWVIDDKDVLSFGGSGRSQGGQDLGFIQLLNGKSSGKTDISISFSCNFISTGSFSHSRLYNASVSLWVVPDLPLALGQPITWILPPHYTTSNLLPSPPSLPYKGDSGHSPKDSIKYSLLKECSGGENDGISIDGGKIKTTKSHHLACVQAKDRVTGRTAVASCIRVSEVSQIRINSESFPFRSINLAVGSELDLSITYCDDLGNHFHEAYNVTFFKAETNYADIVSIDPRVEKIHLKAIRHGRALVQVSLSNDQKKSDYILVSVGAHVYPENPTLGLGSHVDFNVHDLNDQASGQWSSDNTSVLSIMPSGKAEAIGEGKAQVIFEGSGFKLQTGVTVSKGNIVTVDAPKETITNAPFPAAGYKFLVRFSDSYNPYDCKADPPFVGYAKPWRDLNTGNSYCLFFPYSPEHLVLSIPNSIDTKHDVSVSVTASLRGANHVSGSASAHFVGGFSILGIDPISLQLTLTPESNSSILTVVGNTDVDVEWQDRDLLMVSPIFREQSGMGGRAQYEVKVLKISDAFKKKITFTLVGNGQRVDVEVNHETGKRGLAAVKPNKLAVWGGILGSLTLLALTVAGFIWILDRPERVQRPTTTSWGGPAPVTPERGGSVVSEQSPPRTPQPFVDYLRRTIDETPYYRTEGRRRFNPQNTF